MRYRLQLCQAEVVNRRGIATPPGYKRMSIVDILNLTLDI
jgi:hypothetical protein